MKSCLLTLLATCLFLGSALAATPVEKNRLIYQKRQEDPILKEMEKADRDLQKQKDEKTAEIRERQKAEKEKKKEAARQIASDMTGVNPPASVESFTSPFHFAPVRQYLTGTCWSFSGTSYFESEIYRLTGKKIKLSEMWTPYHEYLEKCRRFIRERGDSFIGEGSEAGSLIRIWKMYGVVPATAYPGVTHPGEKYDHSALIREIRLYLDFVKKNNLWDEDANLKHIALILDRYMGHPPDRFEYDGRTMTPKEFLARETGLNMDDYVSVMSTLYYPFFTRDEFRSPDNWWHSKDYVNVPLDQWYTALVGAIKAGYTVILGGDVSEPGKLGPKDVAFIPSFDIPAEYIDQSAREYRIANHTTTDDHAIHLVGYTRVGDQDWFLIKDSGSSANWGPNKGYYFFRGDYLRLKILFFTVHKDCLKDILSRVKATP